MHVIKKSHLICCAILVAMLILLVMLSEYKLSSEFPKISASIQIREVYASNIEVTWEVENSAQEDISFADNNIIQAELNGKKILCPVSAQTLAPGEKFSIDITLSNVNINIINNLKFSAVSNEGTTVTIKETIYPDRQEHN